MPSALAKRRRQGTRYEAGDAYILPGIIDGQTHAGSYLGLPGIEPTTRSAIAGGVTTLVDMPYDNPEPLSSSAHLATKVEAIHRYAHANVALYGTVMPGQSLDEVSRLAEGGVVGFKISAFESSPTRFPRIDAAMTARLCSRRLRQPTCHSVFTTKTRKSSALA